MKWPQFPKVKPKWLWLPPSGWLQCHTDILSNAFWSEKFGFYLLFDAIKIRWKVIIWQVRLTRDWTRDYGSKWYHQRKMAAPWSGISWASVLYTGMKWRAIIHLYLQSLINTYQLFFIFLFFSIFTWATTINCLIYFKESDILCHYIGPAPCFLNFPVSTSPKLEKLLVGWCATLWPMWHQRPPRNAPLVFFSLCCNNTDICFHQVQERTHSQLCKKQGKGFFFAARH